MQLNVKNQQKIPLEHFWLFKTDVNPSIIDVRTKAEYLNGHIQGAYLMDINEPSFPEKVADMSKFGYYLLYCDDGERSESAMKLMNRLGFNNVYVLEGGIFAWRSQGYELV